MNKTQVRVIAFAAIFTLFNCGANEESPSPEIIPDPDINVGQFEVSEFIYNGALESDEFEATFGDETITVYKSGENTLAYSVPLLEPGVYELNIPSLNHQVYVSVSETVLTETPEEILDGLENTFSSYTSALPDDDVDKGMISSVNSAFSEMLKNASIEEKKQLALYYQANKKVFDALLNPNYDNTDGRIADCVFCTAANLKFGYSLLVFGSGVAVAWLAPEPATKLLGAVAAILGWKTAKGFLTEITNERLKVLGSAIDGILSSARVASSSLEFISGEAQILPFVTNNRTLTSDDRTSETEGLNTFFNSYDKFSEIIDKLNGVINFVNDKVFFANIDNIPTPNISNAPIEASYEVESSFFSNYSFSVANSQISVSASLAEAGKLELTLTADQALLDVSESVETQLIITYDDEFNSSVQKIDVVLVVENHTLEAYSGSNQKGNINEALPDPIEVIIKDQDGKPVENAMVNFSVTEGSISAGDVYTNVNGLASTMWTLGSTVGEQTLEVTAYESDGTTPVQGSPLNIKAIAEEAIFEFTGLWHIIHYTDDTRTQDEFTQISEIDFQNIRDDLSLPVYLSTYIGVPKRSYNGGWSEVADPYQYNTFWKQQYVTSGGYISLTSTYYGNIEYRFYLDKNHPNELLGESIGLSNNGLNMKMVKQ